MVTLLTAPQVSRAPLSGTPSPARPNVLVRIAHAIARSRQRKAERDIAEILARRGGV